MHRVVALILAGGRVDELHPFTKYRPKSAVPFGGVYRIIDFSLSNLMHSRVSVVGLLSQYRSSPLINHILDGSSWDLSGKKRSLTLLPPFLGEKENDWYDGTVDAVNQNLNFIQMADPEMVLILSGDHIYKMNYQDIIDYHVKKNADLTIGFIRNEPSQSYRFGVADIDNEDGITGGKVLEYYEKPAEKSFNWASMTVFVFNTKFLYKCLEEFIPVDRSPETIEFGRNIIPKLVNNPGRSDKIYGYKFKGYWAYTRTLSEYWHSNMDVLYNRFIDLEFWQVRTNLKHRGIDSRVPAIFKQGSGVKNSLVCKGCIIHGKVENSILSPGVVVGKGSEIYNSIIMFDSKIGDNVFLNNSIIDVDVTISSGLEFGNQSNLEANPKELKAISEGEKRD
ncbi:glucose-1-phosphate adenylyltransferase [candidate division KSB1 bacterium]|nr:glucose-1-phosphate adenylyltransferase [candidate division KSB1 bacterium]